MAKFYKRVLIMFLGALILAGCVSLKSSKPLFPIKSYERLLMGRVDANYVGTNNCLATCHTHDRIRRDFEASTMGAQLSSGSGMPLVDCESCHGPGSLAVKGLNKKQVESGEQTKCDTTAFIDIKSLPPGAQSLMCLKCHTANATFNLHEWNAGAHAVAEVTCQNCHNVHVGPDLITSPREVKDMCLSCHEENRAEFSMLSHHPINEGKVTCTDCHNPHGTTNENLLKDFTVKETCVRCHAEKRGPFVYEHADLNEDCTECHQPHGSPNRDMLNAREFFLCLQCHSGHRLSDASSTTGEVTGTFYTRCTDCHSTIHGTDKPSSSGIGSFLN